MIAFSSKRDGESQIYIMDSDGANIVRITDFPHAAGDPTWLPNGKIAFRTRTEIPSTPDIYIMDADGTNIVNTNIVNLTLSH